MLVLAAAIGKTNHEGWLTAWFVLFIFVGLPVFILTWIDLGKALRSVENPPRIVRAFGVLLGIPQALLGLMSIILGGTLIGWVLFNTLIERQPQYRGGFLTFGIGPALVLFGWLWLRAAFRNDLKTTEKSSS